MSEPQARPTTALLARKGLAAPVGAASDAALAQAPALGSETLPEVCVLAQATAAPAASLRPLDFPTGRPPGRSVASDLARIAPDRPDAAPEVAVVPASVPTGEPELSAKPEVPRPDPAPDPAPGPALRVDAGTRPAARAAARWFPARAAGLVLALAAAGYGYQSGWFATQPPQPSEAPAAAAGAPLPAPPEAADTVSAPPVAASSPSPGGPSTGAGQPSVDVVRIEPDGAAVIAGRAAPGTELILLDNGAPIGTVTADAYGEWVFIATSPLPRGAHDFGLVVMEVRGGVSVPAAGPATATQDAARDVAQDATQDVTAPGVAGVNETGTAVGADAAVPIPPRKPDSGTTPALNVPTPAFVVQLASVKSRTGAQQEWRALRQRFPEILSQMSLSLDEAKLAGGVSVVRLRIGAFPKQADADALCARLAAKLQDCLVVRTAVKR